MKCNHCQHENANTAKFCENCGKPLMIVCPECKHTVSANSKFCSNCGHNLSVAPVAKEPAVQQSQTVTPPAPEIAGAKSQNKGERKTVTVLFTDIVGSTAIAEKLDPEEWGEIVTGAHQRVSDVVYRYDGTIAQLLGDGVLVFFGAPVSHEDDAERAVHAAVEILDSIRTYASELKQRGIAHFQMRVGLNTGLVVVGNVGSDKHVEYLAIGDTVNLAARMQSAADADSVLISASTARLTKHAFDLDSRGNIELKGKSEPVAVFRVVRAKHTPKSARGIEGLDSPLVGREREVQILNVKMQALVEGTGHIISLMGEAGLGKSRLTGEVVMRSALDFDRYEGRCKSYTGTVPYAPFIDLFTRMFDLSMDEKEDVKYSKINDPFIATMLGIKLVGEQLERVKYLDPPTLREKIFGSIGAIIENRCQSKPTALIFEDLHWADSNSIEILLRLMPLTDRVPLLILAVFRPQQQELSWRFHTAAQSNYTQRYTPIAIEPLSETQSKELVSNLLTIDDLPEKVRNLILIKAEGNPFFVEEVIRSLLDAKLVVREGDHWRATREIVNIALPDTLAGVIQARLDRLDESAKKVAQTAAVIGREFTFYELSQIVDENGALEKAITTLLQRELIREKNISANPSYLFKHVLTQEAAYNSLLLSRRRETHRKVAVCFEKFDATRTSDIARHFVEAQELNRALPYLIESAEKSAGAYAIAEALAQFAVALDIAKNIGNVEMARRAFEGIGGAQTFAGNPVAAMETYTAMNDYARAHKDMSMQISALNKQSLVQGLFFAQLDEAEAKLDESKHLADLCEDKAGLAEHYMMRCNVGMAKADFANMVGQLGQLVETGKALNSKHNMAFGLTHTANTWVFMAEFDKAWDAVRTALRYTRENQDRKFLSEVLGFSQAFVYLSWGQIEAAVTSAKEGARMASEISYAYIESLSNMVLGYMARLQGDYKSAMSYYQRTIRTGQMSGYPFMVGVGLSGLCATQIDIDPNGNKHSAYDLYQQSAQVLDGPMGLFCGGMMWCDMCDYALAMGDLDSADAMTNKGLTMRTAMANLMRPQLFINAARIALLKGDCNTAEESVKEARAFATKHDMTYFRPMITLMDAEVSMARNDHRQALTKFGQAESLAQTMNLRPVIFKARMGSANLYSTMGRDDEAQVMRDNAHASMLEL